MSLAYYSISDYVITKVDDKKGKRHVVRK